VKHAGVNPAGLPIVILKREVVKNEKLYQFAVEDKKYSELLLNYV